MPFGQKPTQFLHKCVEIVKNAYTSVKLIPPAGFEQLLQHTGLTHIYKQGGTECGTVVEDSRLVQMLQALSSLTDDERELLAELLKKMG
jgi:hypothetical protein